MTKSVVQTLAGVLAIVAVVAGAGAAAAVDGAAHPKPYIAVPTGFPTAGEA